MPDSLIQGENIPALSDAARHAADCGLSSEDTARAAEIKVEKKKTIKRGEEWDALHRQTRRLRSRPCLVPSSFTTSGDNLPLDGVRSIHTREEGLGPVITCLEKLLGRVLGSSSRV